MKRLSAIVVFLWAAATAAAQSHSVTLAWVDVLNLSGTPYNVYRADGVCPTAPPATTAGFVKLNSAAIAGMTYPDISVVAGKTYSYLVTAVSGSTESAPSPCAQAVVPALFPVSSVTVTAK